MSDLKAYQMKRNINIKIETTKAFGASLPLHNIVRFIRLLIMTDISCTYKTIGYKIYSCRYRYTQVFLLKLAIV